jgi:hypothetical protein
MILSAPFANTRGFLPRSLCTSLALAIAALCLVQSQSQCRADDLKTIVDAYRKHERAIKSFSVEYHTTASALGPPRDILRYLNINYLANTRETFSYKDGMRHYTMSHPNNGVYGHLVNREADGSPSEVKVVPGVENATNGKLVFTLDGKKQWRRTPAGIIGLPDRQKSSDESQFNQIYLKTVLRFLPDVFKVDPARYRYSLVGLAEQSLLRLKTGREKIEGAECAVLEWADKREIRNAPRETLRFHHTIWCDPALAYSVRQHDVYLDDDRTLVRHTVLNDFTEVTPEVWYPKHVMIDECAYPGKAPRNALGKPLIRTDLVVDNININNVTDEIFTPAIPPGTTICDTRFVKDGQPVNYVQPASQTELDGIIAGIMADDHVMVQSPHSRSPALARLLLINGLIVFAVVALFWWRRRSMAARKSSSL